MTSQSSVAAALCHIHSKIQPWSHLYHRRFADLAAVSPVLGQSEGWIFLDWKEPVDSSTVTAYRIKSHLRPNGP